MRPATILEAVEFGARAAASWADRVAGYFERLVRWALERQHKKDQEANRKIGEA